MAKQIDIRNIKLSTPENFSALYNYSWAAERGINFLNKCNIYPLNYQNENLPLLNLLGLYVYFSGSLHVINNGGAGGAINGGREPLHIPKEKIEKGLGLKLEPNVKGYVFGENGSYYARLLSNMGFYTNQGKYNEKDTKARSGSKIPDYLTFLIENYSSLNKDSKSIGGRLLRDTINIWFDTKAAPTGERQLRAELLGQPTQEQLKNNATQLSDAINILYPRVNSNVDEDLQTWEDEGIWGGYLRFSLEQLLGFPKRSASPIRFSIIVEPRLSCYRN